MQAAVFLASMQESIVLRQRQEVLVVKDLLPMLQQPAVFVAKAPPAPINSKTSDCAVADSLCSQGCNSRLS